MWGPCILFFSGLIFGLASAWESRFGLSMDSKNSGYSVYCAVPMELMRMLGVQSDCVLVHDLSIARLPQIQYIS